MSDIFIPIGSNCETGHFLRHSKRRDKAYPFDWNCASLEMVSNVISNNFEGFLDDIYIGERTKRLCFDDCGRLKITNEEIFPVICKKYHIMFPHDFNRIDESTIKQVKNNYAKRIDRFLETINSTNNIYLVYCNCNYLLNDWQTSVYNNYDPDILKRYTSINNNIYYLEKIKKMFREKQNIKIISLDQLKSCF